MASPSAGELLLVRFRKVLCKDHCYYLIYINDIDIDLYSKLCKFADDTNIGRAVATEEEVQKLRADLNNLAKWAIDGQMLFNVGKMFGHAHWCK